MTAPVSGRPEFDPRTGAGGFGRRHDADIDESCYLMPQAAHPASRRVLRAHADAGPSGRAAPQTATHPNRMGDRLHGMIRLADKSR